MNDNSASLGTKRVTRCLDAAAAENAVARRAPVRTAAPAGFLFERKQTLGEEIANSISHGLALFAALVAAPFLVMSAARQGDMLDAVGVSVFALTMVLLYSASTLYHALPARATDGRSGQRRGAKGVFKYLITAPSIF